MTLATIYALLFYFGFAVLFIGTAYNIYLYARTPAPLKIPTMPAPRTRNGAILRVLSEVVLFKSLFRGNKWTWLFAMMFHASLLLITVRHLRYFIEPVWWWIVVAQPFGKYAGFIMIAGLIGLLGRRILVQRVRYISNPSDYLMLILLLIIGFSGAMLSFVVHTDIVQFKAFMLSVMYFQMFNWQPLPADIPLLVHLSAVILLMIIFPFSKLLHAPGVFFSPTRNQVDDSRENRHLAPWAAKLEAK